MEIKLTAQQIEYVDEISFDMKAADATLKLALQNHSNRVNELTKSLAAWWKDIAETHGLDLEADVYEIKNVRGAVAVVRAETDKNNLK